MTQPGEGSGRPADERDLYDDAPCGYLSATADGVVTRANATLLSWLGLDRGGLDGRHFSDLLRPGARVVWLTHHVPRLEQANRIDAVALELVRDDGSALPVLVSATTVPVAGAIRPDVRMTVVDASERRAYELELLHARQAAERAEWRLRALQQVTQACSGATGEDELLANVAAAVTDTLELGCTRIWLWSDGTFTLAAAAGDGAPPAADTPDPRVRAAMTSGKPVLPAEVGGAVTWAAVPWAEDGTSWGVVETCVPEVWPGTGPDLEVLAVMGAVVGQALERARLHQRLQRLALHDALTGLPNRVLFADNLERALSTAGRQHVPIALLFVDLDDFKAVNDVHGHDAGDRVLQVSADRLRSAVRGGDVVARLGGDEFVVLCPGADELVAEDIATRVRGALGRPIGLGAAHVSVGGSVGVSVARPPYAEGTGAELLAAGDAAMYAEKRRRRPANLA